LGGPFASSFREQILAPATPSDRVLHEGLDVLVWGEAKGAIDQLLEYLRAGPRHDSGPPRLLIPEEVGSAEPGSRSYLNDRSVFPPLNDVPLPRWDLIRVSDYDSMMVQTTAGCPFRCDFCDIIQFNGGFSRPKPPALVRRELEAILATGFRGGVFTVDDNFIGSPTATAQLLDEMIEFQRAHGYPFGFLTQASVDLGTPKLAHLVEKMRLAGFQSVFLGIENPDPEALRSFNKKQNIKVDLDATVRVLQENGIEVYGGFIFGSDQDTVASAERIVAFVKRSKIFTAMTGMLTPIPFTPLHERLRREGRLRLAEYSGNNTDDNVQFEPARMTAAQLQAGSRAISVALFTAAEAYRRALDSVAAVRHHGFNSGRFSARYVKAAVASIWGQGIRRHDRDYFRLLRSAFRLDRQFRRRLRRDAREVARLLRDLAVREQTAWSVDREHAYRLAGLARDYLVRQCPEVGLAEVTSWFAGVRARIDGNALTVADITMIGQNAMASLRDQARQYRFPGIKLRKAFEAAIRGWHYQKAMAAPTRR